jgi:hypothetical protein
MLQEQWKVADFLYECGQLRWQNPPAYLVTLEQGGDGPFKLHDHPLISSFSSESCTSYCIELVSFSQWQPAFLSWKMLQTTY